MAKWNPMRDGGREWILLKGRKCYLQRGQKQIEKKTKSFERCAGECFKVASQRIIMDEIIEWWSRLSWLLSTNYFRCRSQSNNVYNSRNPTVEPSLKISWNFHPKTLPQPQLDKKVLTTERYPINKKKKFVKVNWISLANVCKVDSTTQYSPDKIKND